MVSPVESVSVRNVAAALVVGSLFNALGDFFGGLTPPFWLALLLIVFVIAGSGVRPVGGTLGFNALLGVLLTALGVVAASVYGWRARQRGLWAPAERSPFSFGPPR